MITQIICFILISFFAFILGAVRERVLNAKLYYTKEDMLKASQYGYEYHQNTNFPDTSWEDNCKNNTRQWLTTLKEQKDE